MLLSLRLSFSNKCFVLNVLVVLLQILLIVLGYDRLLPISILLVMVVIVVGDVCWCYVDSRPGVILNKLLFIIIIAL